MTDISYDLRLAYSGLDDVRILVPHTAIPLFDLSIAILRARIEQDAKVIEAAEVVLRHTFEEVVSYPVEDGGERFFDGCLTPTEYIDALEDALAARERVK